MIRSDFLGDLFGVVCLSLSLALLWVVSDLEAFAYWLSLYR